MKQLFWAVFVLFACDCSAQDFAWNLPAGFPKPLVPPDNPMSAAKVELGRYLFYDVRMSVNGKQSCASCHQQKLAFTDGKSHAIGTTGEQHPRGSMSLVNVAYTPSLTWANPFLTSLEAQALVPMLGTQPVELGLKGREQEFLDMVERDSVYQTLFSRAFAGDDRPYKLANVVKAVAAFERSIVSLRSPYDRYRWGGEVNAISESAKRGELIFSGQRGRCFQCHGGWNFSGAIRFAGGKDDDDAQFFNTGVAHYAAPNRGLFEHTNRPEDIGRFRPPTLRNIAVTAPYMHDGSLGTLAEVLDHYSAGGRFDDRNKSPRISALQLSDAEKADLMEFLKSLTDEEVLRDPRWSDPWPEARSAAK